MIWSVVIRLVSYNYLLENHNNNSSIQYHPLKHSNKQLKSHAYRSFILQCEFINFISQVTIGDGLFSLHMIPEVNFRRNRRGVPIGSLGGCVSELLPIQLLELFPFRNCQFLNIVSRNFKVF